MLHDSLCFQEHHLTQGEKNIHYQKGCEEFAATWTELETLILREVSQKEKDYLNTI